MNVYGSHLLPVTGVAGSFDGVPVASFLLSPPLGALFDSVCYSQSCEPDLLLCLPPSHFSLLFFSILLNFTLFTDEKLFCVFR